MEARVAVTVTQSIPFQGTVPSNDLKLLYYIVKRKLENVALEEKSEITKSKHSSFGEHECLHAN